MTTTPRGRRPTRWWEEETGAAAADFAMVTPMLVLVFLAVMQLGFALHVRNTVISCAAEGARFGARDGSTPADGAARTKELVTRSIDSRYARDVRASEATTEDGTRVVVVEVDAPLPVVGPLAIGHVQVRGRAYAEDQ